MKPFAIGSQAGDPGHFHPRGAGLSLTVPDIWSEEAGEKNGLPLQPSKEPP